MQIYVVTIADGQQFFMRINHHNAQDRICIRYHWLDRKWHRTPFTAQQANCCERQAATLLSNFYYEGETDDHSVSTVELCIKQDGWIVVDCVGHIWLAGHDQDLLKRQLLECGPFYDHKGSTMRSWDQLQQEFSIVPATNRLISMFAMSGNNSLQWSQYGKIACMEDELEMIA